MLLITGTRKQRRWKESSFGFILVVGINIFVCCSQGLVELDTVDLPLLHWCMLRCSAHYFSKKQNQSFRKVLEFKRMSALLASQGTLNDLSNKFDGRTPGEHCDVQY